MVNRIKFVMLTIIFISPFSFGEIYKCTDENQKLSYSDKQCSKEKPEETVTLKERETDWLILLQHKKPSSVKITDIVRSDDEITIEYEFESPTDVSNLMRLANTLSNMNVTLLSINKNPGRARMRVSNKPGPLFSKSIKSNKKPRSLFSNPIKNSKKSKRTDKKPQEIYKNSKCTKAIIKHTKKLSYEEVCKYGAACPDNKTDEKIVMHCLHKAVSQCFENKAWRTMNELVGISNSIKIRASNSKISIKNGIRSGETCIFYD